MQERSASIGTDAALLAEFPQPVPEIAVALSKNSGAPVETVAVAAVAIAGAALGHVSETGPEDDFLGTPALQLALVGAENIIPPWLGALLEPLENYECLLDALRERHPPAVLVRRSHDAEARFNDLVGRPGVTDAALHIQLQDAARYRLAAREETLLVSNVHPWRPHTLLGRAGAPPLWVPGSPALAQWTQLLSHDRSLLYGALWGDPKRPGRTCPFIVVTPVDAISYWLKLRGNGLPLIYLPAGGRSFGTEPLEAEAARAWKDWVQTILAVRSTSSGAKIHFSAGALRALKHFEKETREMDENLPRGVRSRAGVWLRFCRGLGCLLHALECSGGGEISEGPARAAMGIARRVIEGEVEIIRTIGRRRPVPPVVPPIERPDEVEVLAEKIHSSPTPLTRRQLSRKFNYMPAGKLNELLQELRCQSSKKRP